MAAKIATLDAKIDALSEKLKANGAGLPAPVPVAAPSAAPLEAAPPAAPPAAPLIDMNQLLHDSRTSLMRDMPPGANRLLSAGCSGRWYFDWIEQTYGYVQEHLGIEYYSPKPDSLPDNVTWIANTAGNMEAVADQSCDLLVSGQNIEHLWPEDIADFLVESARVLRPGGILCVDSPNRAMTEPLIWTQPEHTIELTVPEIRKLLELAGFEVTKEAGIWLCQDPKTHRMLPYDPNSPDSNWTVSERIFSARDKPEQSLLWWLESRRTARAPDRKLIGDMLAEIFSKAWPERCQRYIVLPEYRTETRADGEWVVVPPGRGGMVMFGPYVPLRAGRHKITFDLVSDAGTTDAFARCDVAIGPNATIVQQRDVLPGSGPVTFDVEVSELTFGGQFRCISLGRSGFSVRRFVALEETLA
jgi:SAM-dependent methyltransferase